MNKITRIDVSVLTARTVSLRLIASGAKYHLDSRVGWELRDNDGVMRSGDTSKSVLFIDDLQPDREYTLSLLNGISCKFKTDSCAGLISITSYGADPALSDNQAAISRAIENVPKGGTLFIPKGFGILGSFSQKAI